MNNPDHIYWSLDTNFLIFGVKILKFFDADPGSGMETVQIRDGKVGSGINIQDPQHCLNPITYVSKNSSLPMSKTV
jgi:hypothetical protein